MAISIDWATQIISVPKADLTLVQSNPTEIRALDLNQFRLELKDNEDNEDGMPFPDTHRHVEPVTVGGVDLARVVEIINGYTVTFEDGQYAVNLAGANSNVADRVNVNQVSVRSANSAGLVTSAAIEYGEYGGGVTINQTLTTTGTGYPMGTLRSPVGNIPDAMLIAASRGFRIIKIIGDITLDTGDNVESMILIGEDPTHTLITINNAAETQYTQFKNATIGGILDGDSVINNCTVQDINYVTGRILNSFIEGTVSLAAGANAHILDCFDATIDSIDPPTVNMGGSGQNLAIRAYNGRIGIENMSGGFDNVVVDMASGTVHLTPTVSAGHVELSGIGTLEDDSTGTVVIDNKLLAVIETGVSGLTPTESTALLNIDTKVDANTVTLDGIGTDVSTITGSISVIETDIGTIEGDISTIQTDITSINGMIVTIDTNIGTIQADVGDIETAVTLIEAIERGEWKIENNQMIFYDTGSAEVARFDLFNSAGAPTNEDVYNRKPV